MIRVAVLVALFGTACATRIPSGVYTEDGGGFEVDSGEAIDLSTPPDFTVAAIDLAVPGKTCGQIIQCDIGCGLMLGACQLMCAQGGSPEGDQEATALILCAAQSCAAGLQGDGGAGNLLACVFEKCGTQAGNCKGLGF